MRSLMLSLLLLLPACGAHKTASAGGTQVGEAADACDDGCPMKTEGVQVVYEDTADGAAIAFTSEADKVPDLQAKIAMMAEKHNQPRPHHVAGHVAHSARADNTATGGRLIMTPAAPAELEALRTHVRQHVDQMQRGGCNKDCCQKHDS